MPEPEIREFVRRSAELVTICASGERTYDVVICNLSEGGCLVEGDDLSLAPDTRAEVRIETFGTFAGAVRWSAGARCGIEFDAPIHSAVVQYIATRADVAVEGDDKTRDRFGRVLPPPPCPSRMGEILAD